APQERSCGRPTASEQPTGLAGNGDVQPGGGRVYDRPGIHRSVESTSAASGDASMMTRLRRTALAAALLCAVSVAFGADFDGSKRLICATVDADACDPGGACVRGLPGGVGAPR